MILINAEGFHVHIYYSYESEHVKGYLVRCMHQDMFYILTDMYRYDEHLEFFHITSNSVKNSLVVKLELQKCASMYIELSHFLHD